MTKKTNKSKDQTFEGLKTLIIFRRSLIYQTKEFFQNSTLHGVRYIAETGRPIGEKFMWFCFTTTGLVTALIIIMSLWEKFQTNPTITGLDTDFRNQQTMFPTIVLCPIDPFDIEKGSEIIKRKLESTTDEEQTDRIIEFLKLLTKLSFDTVQQAYEISKEIEEIFPVENENLRIYALKLFQPIDNFIEECIFRGDKFQCDKYFNPLYTSRGLCYGFNSRFQSTNFDDVKVSSSHSLLETDKQWSLHLTPTNETKMDLSIFPREEYFGADYKTQLSYDSDQESKILISKKSTFTTEDTRQLTIKQRKCIFEDESELQYYKEEYTFSSCMKECRLRLSLKLCGCVPPFYKPIAKKPMCKISQFPCLHKNKGNITNIRDCNDCELSCQKNVYNIEKLTKNHEKPPGIKIEFLTWPIIRYKREVLFGWVDLLVSFGGIAGLFLGFSLLSGVEIIYYFTMRACCMVYRNKKELCEIEMEIANQRTPQIDMSLKLRKRHFVNQQNINPQPIQSEPLPFTTKHDENELILKPNEWNEINENLITTFDPETRKIDQNPSFLQWYRLRFQQQPFTYLP